MCSLAALFLSKPLAAGLFLVGLLVALTAWEPVASRLPSVSIKVRPPQRAGRRRLRHDALSLVGDIRRYVKDAPSAAAFHAESVATNVALRAAKDEQERQGIAQAHSQRLMEQSEREGQELAERFGGRVRHVADEFVRRGLLERGDADKMAWEIKSQPWTVEAANRIEGLALHL